MDIGKQGWPVARVRDFSPVERHFSNSLTLTLQLLLKEPKVIAECVFRARVSKNETRPHHLY